MKGRALKILAIVAVMATLFTAGAEADNINRRPSQIKNRSLWSQEKRKRRECVESTSVQKSSTSSPSPKGCSDSEKRGTDA